MEASANLPLDSVLDVANLTTSSEIVPKEAGEMELFPLEIPNQSHDLQY